MASNIKDILKLIISVVFIIALSLVLSTPCYAKTLAEYDKDIKAQEKVVKEKELAAQFSQYILADATSWYYKNVSPIDLAEVILNNDGIAEVIDKIAYMDKIYATYMQRKYEAEEARNNAIGAQQALQALKDEKKNRAYSLDNAGDIQFPQSNNQPWSDIKYWNGTIASSGCGVCAYTVVIDMLCGKDYTPKDMMKIRGDWRGMDGFPDDDTGVKAGKTHAGFTKETFDIETWNIDVSLDELKDVLKEKETAAIICARGEAFKNKTGEWRYSNGHFIVVLGYDEKGFHVSDSAYEKEEGADVVYSDREMRKMLSGTSSITVYSN